MFTKFSNLPKNIAVLLDCILILGIGIFTSVCVTVWIAKRYGNKRENMQFEAKLKVLHDSIAWLKLLIFKEVESINSVLYFLQYNTKFFYTKTVNITSSKAIDRILNDIENIQLYFLSRTEEDYSYFKDEINQKAFENYFYKFTTGYYQKVFDVLQEVMTNYKENDLFTEDECQQLQQLLSNLQYVICGPIEKSKKQFIEEKKQCWMQILSFIDCFQLENSLQDNVEAMLYFENANL